jgi:4-amino-4-deoxy-L-arabinose transferase-like glycosyltransferase
MEATGALMSPSRWRRLLVVYVLLLVPIGWLATKYEPYQVDGDAVSYMDIADLLHAHRWAGAVNGYWHPLYPALLACAQVVFYPTRWNELGAYYVVNYAIFGLQLAAMLLFVAGLVKLRRRMGNAGGQPLLSRAGLSFVGLALVVIASQRELSMGKIRPDALLQALMLLAFAMLLEALATESLVYAPLMGLFFGLAYLTKSFALLMALLSIAVMVVYQAWLQRRRLSRVVAGGAMALMVFVAVAGPYIAALSRQKGRFDFGDSGSLNYAWYSGGVEKMHLEPWMTKSFGPATVKLVHPEQQLLASPGIYSYRAEPYGTYPDWFDTTFFNERIVPHLDAPVLLRRDARNAMLVVRYLLDHPEAWVLLFLLLACGARLRFGSWQSWRDGGGFWLPMILLGLAMWMIYGIVNIEERYVTLAYLVVALPVFAALRVPDERMVDGREARPSDMHSRWLRPVAAGMAALLAMLAAGESLRMAMEQRRELFMLPHPWYGAEMFQAAEGLQAMGVRPGDEVACMGTVACLNQNYWARLADVRILTEVYNPNGQLFQQWAGLPNRQQVYDVLRAQGAKVLVAQFDPGAVAADAPAAAGWVRLGTTVFYAFPLTLHGTLAPGARSTTSIPAELPWTTTREGGP